jgi:hypothetical protein
VQVARASWQGYAGPGRIATTGLARIPARQQTAQQETERLVADDTAALRGAAIAAEGH